MSGERIARQAATPRILKLCCGGFPIGEETEERGLAYLNKDGNVRVSKDGDWSETYACNLFDWHLKTQEKLDWLTGSAQWIFKDFASPLRADDGIPNVNQKGVVQRDLSLKESYFVFQSYWSKETDGSSLWTQLADSLGQAGRATHRKGVFQLRAR